MGRGHFCNCLPFLLHAWRGQPDYLDNSTLSFPHSSLIGSPGITYQWRIRYNLEDAQAEADRITSGILSVPQTYQNWQGPVRDGELIGLPLNHPGFDVGGFEYPWRLEAGCVKCRCVDSRRIFWPIRNEYLTTPVRSGVDIVGVTQDQYADTSDFGRVMSADESSIDYWHGSTAYSVSNPRKCNPSEIRWLHRYTQFSNYSGSPQPETGLLITPSDSVQWATGWFGTGAAVTRETFSTTDISGVRRITLLQPVTDSPEPGDFSPAVDDPAEMPSSETDALAGWLDDGPPRLLTISGAGGFWGNMNDFLSMFCDLRIGDQFPGIGNPGSSAITNLQYVARDSEYVNHPFSASVPTPFSLFGTESLRYYYSVSGGDTLYDLEYELAGTPQSYPAVTMEIRDNGSVIILAPQFGYTTQSGALFRTWSPYDLVNIYSSGVLSHSDYLLSLFPAI